MKAEFLLSIPPPKPQQSEIDKHCVGEGNWEMSMLVPSHFSQVYKKKKCF